MPFTNIDLSLPQDWADELKADQTLQGETVAEKVYALLWRHLAIARVRELERKGMVSQVFAYGAEKKAAAEARQ